MSEIERLARVLYESNPVYGHKEGWPERASWGEVSARHRESLAVRVRAILTAMREPSDAMKDAATAKMGDPPEFGNYEARFVWQAMIDAALREEVPA